MTGYVVALTGNAGLPVASGCPARLVLTPPAPPPPPWEYPPPPPPATTRYSTDAGYDPSSVTVNIPDEVKTCAL